MLILLTLAAFCSGIVNALAGGGAFLTFPTLLFAGIDAVAANATSTVALFPGQAVAGLAQRRELEVLPPAWRRDMWVLSAISVVGGAVGAGLLLLTPSSAFRALVPWLLLAATVIFAAGGRVRGERRWLGPWALRGVQAVVSVYGGYFGGGIGILMLAALSLTGMRDVRVMNVMKIIFATLINLAAVIIFLAAGLVKWPETAVMMVAAVAGGYAGARLAGVLPPRAVRIFIIVVGCVLTVYFFLRPA
jgi:uncharacterized membrane protein YfcA